MKNHVHMKKVCFFWLLFIVVLSYESVYSAPIEDLTRRCSADLRQLSRGESSPQEFEPQSGYPIKFSSPDRASTSVGTNLVVGIVNRNAGLGYLGDELGYLNDYREGQIDDDWKELVRLAIDEADSISHLRLGIAGLEPKTIDEFSKSNKARLGEVELKKAYSDYRERKRKFGQDAVKWIHEQGFKKSQIVKNFIPSARPERALGLELVVDPYEGTVSIKSDDEEEFGGDAEDYADDADDEDYAEDE